MTKGKWENYSSRFSNGIIQYSRLEGRIFWKHRSGRNFKQTLKSKQNSSYGSSAKYCDVFFSLLYFLKYGFDTLQNTIALIRVLYNFYINFDFEFSTPPFSTHHEAYRIKFNISLPVMSHKIYMSIWAFVFKVLLKTTHLDSKLWSNWRRNKNLNESSNKMKQER